MSPHPPSATLRNKRKSTITPKATESKKTRTSIEKTPTEKIAKPLSPVPHLRSGFACSPSSPSIPADPRAPSDIAFTSTQLPAGDNTNEDLFESTCSSETPNTSELTFLTPEQTPSFSIMDQGGTNQMDSEHGEASASIDLGVGVTNGYDSSASANGSNKFPVVRRDSSPSSLLLRKHLKGFTEILDDRLRRVASKDDINQVLSKVEKNSNNIATLQNDVSQLRNELEDEEVKKIVTKFWDVREKKNGTHASTSSISAFLTGASCTAQDTARRNR